MTLALAFVSLHGDSVLKYDMNGEINTFLYADANHAKMITPPTESGSAEIYFLNQKTYLVTHHEGMTSIVDVDKTKSFVNSMGISFKQEREKEAEPAHFSIKKTGKKQRVAGINGEIWILSDGKKQINIVVTNNKKVVDAVRQMFKMLSQMNMDTTQNFYEMDKGYVIIKAEGMELKEFTTKKISLTEYQLPSSESNKRVGPTAKVQEPSEQEDSSSQTDSISDQDIDKAAKLFKSFF